MVPTEPAPPRQGESQACANARVVAARHVRPTSRPPVPSLHAEPKGSVPTPPTSALSCAPAITGPDGVWECLVNDRWEAYEDDIQDLLADRWAALEAGVLSNAGPPGVGQNWVDIDSGPWHHRIDLRHRIQTHRDTQPASGKPHTVRPIRWQRTRDRDPEGSTSVVNPPVPVPAATPSTQTPSTAAQSSTPGPTGEPPSSSQGELKQNPRRRTATGHRPETVSASAKHAGEVPSKGGRQQWCTQPCWLARP